MGETLFAILDFISFNMFNKYEKKERLNIRVFFSIKQWKNKKQKEIPLNSSYLFRMWQRST